MLQSEKFETFKCWLPLIAAGTGFCLVMFCSTFYFLTRPCVIFECTEINRAEKLALRSKTILQQSRSTKKIILAYEELQQAIALLDNIPAWSDRYLEVQNSLSIYQNRQENLQKLVKAIELRDKAVSLSKNPPFTVDRWKKIQAIWSESLASLEAISKKSEYYAFANQKKEKYQNEITVINNEIAQEKQSIELLEAARSRITLAQKSQNEASSFTDWQLVHSHWERGIELLAKIPEKTTVFKEGQRLKKSLLSELNSAQKRRDLEEIAFNSHNKAIATARVAKQAEKNRQWTKAVSDWEDALRHIQMVPQNTFQYRKTQQLIAPYLYALNIARRERHLILRVERAASDLDKICSGDMKICDRTIENDVIKVSFAANYIERVQQTALQTRRLKNISDRVRVMDHIFSLETALKTIANNAGMRVEVYDDENKLLLTYIPDL